MDNVNTVKALTDSTLSAENAEVVQKYVRIIFACMCFSNVLLLQFSDQLINEPGFRGLLIDGVYVQQDSTSGRKRR